MSITPADNSSKGGNIFSKAKDGITKKLFSVANNLDWKALLLGIAMIAMAIITIHGMNLSMLGGDGKFLGIPLGPLGKLSSALSIGSMLVLLGGGAGLLASTIGYQLFKDRMSAESKEKWKRYFETMKKVIYFAAAGLACFIGGSIVAVSNPIVNPLTTYNYIFGLTLLAYGAGYLFATGEVAKDRITSTRRAKLAHQRPRLGPGSDNVQKRPLRRPEPIELTSSSKSH